MTEPSSGAMWSRRSHAFGLQRQARGEALTLATSWPLAAGAAVVGLAAGVAYSRPARRWYLTWGATAGEATTRLPGDELLPRADVTSTRAVAIDAPTSAVWPWLVQMGSGRGGAYTYDWIVNLFGLGMHSADEILPQFQNLAVGDVLPVGPGGPGMRVTILDDQRSLVFWSVDGTWVWIFHLQADGCMTRLVSRNRIVLPDASWFGRLAYRLVMEPGSLIMERRMLLGIKERAERIARRSVARPVRQHGAAPGTTP